MNSLDPATLDKLKLIVQMQFWKANKHRETERERAFADGLMLAVSILDTVGMLDRGELAGLSGYEPWQAVLDGTVTYETLKEQP